MIRFITLFLMVTGTLCAGALPAQERVPVQFGPGSSVLSRAQLEDLLVQYQAVLESPAYSGGIKDQARASLARIRERLSLGDFRPGDRVALFVQGEAGLPDTVPVEPGPQITLPLFGEISLAGVLRSEIAHHLTRELGRVIRDPVVRAEGLMRLSIQGSVGSPGFYVVPADMLVSEALMVAGGPGATADLEKLRIERGPRRILEGAEMQQALTGGWTVDQLNLQAGDQIYLPERTAGPWGTVGRYALMIGSALWLGVRIF